jgi:MFS transporter, YNFM family, putative membrane transport protein
MSYYVGSAAGGTVGSVVYGRAGWTWLVVVVVIWFGLAAAAALVTDSR